MRLLLWACSSAGRAPALQAGGRRFDPGHVHQFLPDCKRLKKITSARMLRYSRTVCTNASLDHLCAQWRGRQSVSLRGYHFVGSTVELLQCFALHPQLHLGVLLEDLRVALAEQLSDPFVGYASGA